MKPNLTDKRQFAQTLLGRGRRRRLDARYLNPQREEAWNAGKLGLPANIAPEVEPGVPLRCFEVDGVSHSQLVGHQMEALDQADRMENAISNLMEAASDEQRELLAEARDLCQANQPARLSIISVQPGAAASAEEIQAWASSLNRRDPR